MVNAPTHRLHPPLLPILYPHLKQAGAPPVASPPQRAQQKARPRWNLPISVCILGMGWRFGRRMGVVWRWVFSGLEYIGLMPVVLLGNIVLDCSCQGLPVVNDVLAHDSMTSGNGARLFYPTASSLRPSSLPSSSSQARSGWGIIPNTLNASFATPAIWSIEPLGLYASFSAPVGLQ